MRRTKFDYRSYHGRKTATDWLKWIALILAILAALAVAALLWAVSYTHLLLRSFWRRVSVPLDDWRELEAPEHGERAELLEACLLYTSLRRPGAGGRKRYPLATASATRIPSTAADTMPPA